VCGTGGSAEVRAAGVTVWAEQRGVRGLVSQGSEVASRDRPAGRYAVQVKCKSVRGSVGRQAGEAVRRKWQQAGAQSRAGAAAAGRQAARATGMARQAAGRR